MKKRYVFGVFWALVFVGALLALSQSGYSDGDDAYFYQYTHSMGFFEYLGWRYETWVGRMAAEALVYITFNLGLNFWRPVNALMLVLLPIGILRLAAKVARVPEGSLLGWKERTPACGSQHYYEMGIGAAIAAVAGYILMSANTLGYAAVWVNGSIFYTWSFTAGIWALMPFADFAFAKEKPVSDGKIRMSMEGCDWRKFLYTIPCTIIASMAIEQMGAVLLVFEVLALIYGVAKWRRVHPLMLVQTVVTVVAFAILFLAPGNDIRVATEVITWMPEYDTMSLGQHIFITVHWMLSSFANENKLFLCGIWIVGIVLLFQKKERRVADWVCIVLAGVFTVAALLPFAGITVLSDMGMQYLNLTGCIEQVPAAVNMTSNIIFAMCWWGAALIYTFVLIWRASGCQITLLLAYLAGIASEAIMFFSPTMYASGARVYYLTDLLYLLIMLAMIFGLKERKKQYAMYITIVLMGAVNLWEQLWVFLREL